MSRSRSEHDPMWHQYAAGYSFLSTEPPAQVDLQAQFGEGQLQPPTLSLPSRLARSRTRARAVAPVVDRDPVFSRMVEMFNALNSVPSPAALKTAMASILRRPIAKSARYLDQLVEAPFHESSLPLLAELRSSGYDLKRSPKALETVITRQPWEMIDGLLNWYPPILDEPDRVNRFYQLAVENPDERVWDKLLADRPPTRLEISTLKYGPLTRLVGAVAPDSIMITYRKTETDVYTAMILSATDQNRIEAAEFIFRHLRRKKWSVHPRVWKAAIGSKYALHWLTLMFELDFEFAVEKHVELCQTLIGCAKLSEKTADELIPILRLMFEKGLDPNLQIDEQSFLFETILNSFRPRHSELLSLFLEVGFDLSKSGPLTNPLLAMIIAGGGIEEVRLLLSAGASVDRVNDHGVSPLIASFRRLVANPDDESSREVCQLMMSLSSPETIVSRPGWRQPVIEAIPLLSLELIERLVKHGAKIDQPGYHDETAWDKLFSLGDPDDDKEELFHYFVERLDPPNLGTISDAWLEKYLQIRPFAPEEAEFDRSDAKKVDEAERRAQPKKKKHRSSKRRTRRQKPLM